MFSLIRKLALAAVFCLVLAGFAVIAYTIYRSHDPEHYLIKTLVNEDQTIAKALFSPDDDLQSVLVSLIGAEKKSIIIAIYTLTNKEIAQAFVAAHRRGVHIEVVVDPGYSGDRYSKVPLLANDKIPVWVYQPGDREASIMHNKFCIFEDNILHKTITWTGSYNFTVRATTRNQENVVVLDNKNIAEQFSKHFEILKSRCLRISGTHLPYHETHHRQRPSKELTTLWKELKRWLPL